MKILQTIVYVIIIIGLFTAYQQGNIHEQEALFCASEFDARYGSHNQYLYWMENGYCCRFVLDYGTIYEEVIIVESCENGR